MRSYEKPDFWSLKAHKEGYPARSVYKLKEINEKFSLFHSSCRDESGRILKVLDMGAAPGSWSLYLLKTAPGVLVSSVDLSPLSRRYDQGLFDSPNFSFIQGDFTTESVREELVRRGPYSLLLSDAAPATSGNRALDAPRSLALAEQALLYAEKSLLPCGNLAIKVFQGGDTAELAQRLRERFDKVTTFKPKACRKASFEMYYIGLGKKNSC